MRSTGPIMQRPPPKSLVAAGSTRVFSDMGEGGKGRMGRQRGVKCRQFQVNGGHCRTSENVSWPGTIALDQLRRTDPQRGSIPPILTGRYVLVSVCLSESAHCDSREEVAAHGLQISGGSRRPPMISSRNRVASASARGVSRFGVTGQQPLTGDR